MLKRHEVEILLKAGDAKTEVARLAGVSLCSVKRIAQENVVLRVDDVAERAERQIGRPSTFQNFRKPVVEILQQEPDLATLEILRAAVCWGQLRAFSRGALQHANLVGAEPSSLAQAPRENGIWKTECKGVS